jgi:hypothetical protein
LEGADAGGGIAVSEARVEGQGDNRAGEVQGVGRDAAGAAQTWTGVDEEEQPGLGRSSGMEEAVAARKSILSSGERHAAVPAASQLSVPLATGPS